VALGHCADKRQSNEVKRAILLWKENHVALRSCWFRHPQGEDVLPSLLADPCRIAVEGTEPTLAVLRPTGRDAAGTVIEHKKARVEVFRMQSLLF